jgi:UDP-glucuronate decarboxylase
VQTALICSLGTYNCLQAAKQHGARVFHASTSEIYGDPDVHPQIESYRGNVNTVGPRSCYDEGKRFAETLVTDFGRRHGLVTRMARIFNTYGPRMQPDDGRVVSNFIVQALLGRNITVYGSGEQTRSFCYVSDLIDGFARLMDNGDDPLDPVNLGNPVEKTVSELARLIIDLVGSRSRIIYKPLPVTIRAAAGRISPKPKPRSGGRHRSNSPWGCGGPSPTSTNSSAMATRPDEQPAAPGRHVAGPP